jgi:SAM-dependent methyltransferase
LPDETYPNADSQSGVDDWDLHWNRYAEAVELNPAQEFRRRLIMDALAIDRARPRILDIGSGTGALARDLLAVIPDAEVVGLELSATGVAIARRQVPDAKFVEVDLLTRAHAIDPGPGWAEYAVCSEVLEHVDEPGRLIGNALPLMAPGCRLVVTVPAGPVSAFDRHIGHRRHFRVAELRELLEAAGYTVESARAAGFPFFNLYRLAVIAAGRRLIASPRASGAPPSRATRMGASMFGPLMRRNTGGRRLGFQTIAVARTPD